MGLSGLKKQKYIEPLDEITEPLHNPFKGFYEIYRFMLGEEIELPTFICSDINKLSLIEINLVNYKKGNIDEEALNQVNLIFSFFSCRNHAMIVRFLYDWDGHGIQNEPSDIKIITGHISQLSESLKKYTNSIFILQGLLIGNWGEMHSTKFYQPTHLKQLYTALSLAAGGETFMSVRCPNMWRIITDNDDPAESAFRLGLFNDAILASKTDLGTYAQFDSENPFDKWCRERESDFQQVLCNRCPNGGEIIYSELSLDFEKAFNELKTNHFSYLNSQYDEKLLEIWKQNSVGSFNSVWSEKKLYDFAEEYLGYRYIVKDVDFAFNEITRTFTFSASVNNVGTAACYYKWKCDLVLRDGDGVYRLPLDADIRHWVPGINVPLAARIKLPKNKQKREIKISIDIKDEIRNLKIRLANTVVNEFSENSIGKILI